MAVPLVSVDFVAVVLAAIASFVIGMVWYSPMLFGKMWMKEMKTSEKEMKKGKKNMTQSFAFAFVGALVMAYVLAHFIAYATGGYPTLMDGITTAFWAWLGFVATVSAGMVLWGGKSWNLYALTAGNDLVSMLAMGAIIALW
ncbi:MAG: DUF1761 domain-containing protein [Candidatus Norongarragalinales archaeon]